MVTVKVDEQKLISALIVLENYLDGAVADLEEGRVENLDFVEEVIYAHHILEVAYSHGFACLDEDEYSQRFQKVKKEKEENKKD